MSTPLLCTYVIKGASAGGSGTRGIGSTMTSTAPRAPARSSIPPPHVVTLGCVKRTLTRSAINSNGNARCCLPRNYPRMSGRTALNLSINPSIHPSMPHRFIANNTLGFTR
ncbi:unnamed protein product, partial [Sphacelaria rigidula]